MRRKTKTILKFLFIILFSLIFIQIYSINNQVEDELNNFTIDDTTVYSIYDLCVIKCHNEPHLPTANFTNKHLPINFELSTCGESATNRGHGQKVIGFTFYGNVSHIRGYFPGIEKNINLIRNLYPGWIMRLYHNIDDDFYRTLLCELQCKNPDIFDICYIRNIPGYGNIERSIARSWRFNSLADPLVDIAMSRDLDSIITQREVDAVNEWLYNYTNVQFHIMRDNPRHNTPILAGMWGANVKLNRQFWRNVSESILNDGLRFYYSFYYDQVLLSKYVWPMTNTTDFLLTHDSYFCKSYNNNKGIMLGFPTQRKIGFLNFVGAFNGTKERPLTIKCPVECRRNQSWIYC